MLSRHKRIRETVVELNHLGPPYLRLIAGGGGPRDLPSVHDIDRTLRPHHGDLRGRPRKIHIRSKVLRAHDAIRAAIGLAGHDGDFGTVASAYA